MAKMARAFYKGITFNGFDENKSFRRTDVELVKQDLLNHIFTRRGERVMMPTFGTRIPDLLMEPMDNTSIFTIRNDLLEVFNYDPRVNLRSLRVDPLFEERAVVAIAELDYIEMKFTDSFDIRLEFET